jgi:DNA-binding transcriptional LysR family regulator
VAVLEAAAGQRLFERHRAGVTLTAAGSRLLPRARHIVQQLDAALTDVRATPTGRVRVGTFPIAAASIVPRALVLLRAEHPDLTITLREATTPALVRSLRAGTVDVALVAQSPPYRPLDSESPSLDLTMLVERDLMVAVGPGHPLGRRRAVEVEELAGQIWVASGGEGGDSLLGVWPGLAERPDVRYVARDWLTKLRLVAAGLAITTVSSSLVDLLPQGVRMVTVRGEPRETRRLSVVRLAGPIEPAVAAVIEALRHVVRAEA